VCKTATDNDLQLVSVSSAVILNRLISHARVTQTGDTISPGSGPTKLEFCTRHPRRNSIDSGIDAAKTSPHNIFDVINRRMTTALLSTQLTDWADILRAIAALLWPIFAFFALLFFRHEIREILARLKSGAFFGTKLELEAKKSGQLRRK
jgi:hypothetical protein